MNNTPIPSPVTRLSKGYANQHKDGAQMVDLIDTANGHPIARTVYEPYADEILEAVRQREARRAVLAKLWQPSRVPDTGYNAEEERAIETATEGMTAKQIVAALAITSAMFGGEKFGNPPWGEAVRAQMIHRTEQWLLARKYAMVSLAAAAEYDL